MGYILPFQNVLLQYYLFVDLDPTDVEVAKQRLVSKAWKGKLNSKTTLNKVAVSDPKQFQVQLTR